MFFCRILDSEIKKKIDDDFVVISVHAISNKVQLKLFNQ